MVTTANLHFDTAHQVWRLYGDWRITKLNVLANTLKQLSVQDTTVVHIDGSEVSHMDTAGAWLLQQFLQIFKHAKLELSGFSTQQKALLQLIQEHPFSAPALPKARNSLATLGYNAVAKYRQFHDFLYFIGEVTTTVIHRLRYPREIRWRTIAHTIEIMGYRALPLISLLSFLIGVVLTYQMGLQLKNYGANIYIVDLLGLSILREFAPLMTAILLAARTASAFTATLGTMLLNQEIDALRTMGIRPASYLILPRLFALILITPLLTLWADCFGLLGGMLMSKSMLDIHFYDFIQRFQAAVDIENYLIGITKAPVFGAIVAGIGCFQGFQVSGSANNLGTKTTVSVVQSIFLIIIADAIFSIFFTIRGI